MTGIYAIINKVNGKIYVGQAVSIEDRWGDHKARLNRGKHENSHLQRAWDKYGADNFEFTVLMECPEEQLNTMEEYFIFCLDSYDKRVGYNKTYGGGGCRATEDTKRKQSASARIIRNRPEVKRKMSENNPMKRPEVRKKVSESMKIAMNRPEVKRKRSESMKNRKDLSKAVTGIHKVTGLIVEYPSCIEAERQTDISNSHISECCRGKLKSAGGYYWMYADSQE